MWTQILEVLKTLGTTAIIAAAVAWLAKSIVTHLLSRNIESYKAELGREFDKEIEQLKARLQIVAQEHQITFSHLYEKRALIIAESYSLLNDAMATAIDFGGTMVFGGLRTPKPRAEEAYNKCMELFQHFHRHQIFFSEELCALMNEFVDLISNTARDFYYAADDPEENMRFREEFGNRFPELLEKVPALKKQMEKEFRALLGVTIPDSAASNNSFNPTPR